MLVPCLTGRLNVLEGILPEAMKTVFRTPAKYGGAVYSLFISILSTLIHNEPAAYNALNNTGIPAAFLESLVGELLPSSSALSAIPGALSAICLNEEARAKVAEMNIIAPLFAVFANPKYINCLQKRNINIGSSMDELLRHNPTLKPKALEACLTMLEDIVAYGQTSENNNSDKTQESVSDMVLNVSKVNIKKSQSLILS
jgi:E3 ubiquitin-protein ligase HUWE1